jgi:hypothetical protein
LVGEYEVLDFRVVNLEKNKGIISLCYRVEGMEGWGYKKA